MSTWQPIATAPKDGRTPVDLWIVGERLAVQFYSPVTTTNASGQCEGRAADFSWFKGRWWPLGGLYHSLSPDVEATHWMPQPVAPLVIAADGGSAHGRGEG